MEDALPHTSLQLVRIIIAILALSLVGLNCRGYICVAHFISVYMYILVLAEYDYI